MRFRGFRHKKISYRSGQRGALVIETALTLPLFIFALLSMADFMRLAYTAANLQNGIHRMSRCVAVSHSNCSRSTAASTSAATRQAVQALAGITIPIANFSLCQIESDSSCTVPNDASFRADSWMKMQASGTVQTILGPHVLTAEALFKNEPTVRTYTPTLGEDHEEGPGYVGPGFGDEDGSSGDGPGRLRLPY